MNILESINKHNITVVNEPKIRANTFSRILREIDYEELGESICNKNYSKTVFQRPLKNHTIENEKVILCAESDTESRKTNAESAKTKKKKKRR
ncbi:tubulin polyglutamylase TTLL13 isoform X1 [Vespula maculifrons]|uniref:Tubulin polyglutamylase TTLL13 isoform X1 n=2 Tax=Vespula TaxID=7451 RepID=A0ABD2CSI4_VESMC